jgi:hypothetical protein
MTWTAKTSDSEAARRAGGRRWYNHMRQAQATRRFGRIIDIMARNRWAGHEWGIRAKIARELGVSRATIARDLQHLRRALDDPTYAEEWLRFFRYDRRTYGDCFGPRPGAVFPQMDHSKKRMLRAAWGLGTPQTARGSRKPKESNVNPIPNQHTHQRLESPMEQSAASEEHVAGPDCNSRVLDDPPLSSVPEPSTRCPEARTTSRSISTPAG